MTPEQTAVVIQKTIEGVPSRDIGQAIGTSHMAVVRARQKPDVKAIVEAGLSKLIKRGVNPAVNTLCRAAALGNAKGAEDNIDLFKLSIQASDKILSHVSGSGPQTVINQLIYSQGTHASMDDTSMQLVNRVLGLQSQADDVIDLQPVDNPVDK